MRWQFPSGFFWTGAASNDWENANNWTDPDGNTGTFIPSEADTIYIYEEHVTGSNLPTIDATTGNVELTRLNLQGNVSLIVDGGTLDINENITIATGATLTQTSSTDTIYVGGNWSNAGTFNENDATVIFDDSSANAYTITTFDAADNFNNVIFRGTATYSIGAELTINGDISILGGTFSNSVGANLNIYGNWTVNGGVYDGGSGTTYFLRNDGGTAEINGGTFYNVEFSGNSTKSVLSNISVNDITIVDEVGNSLHGNDKLILVGGNWQNNKADGFVPGTSTIVFNGEQDQNIDGTGTQAFHKLTFQGSGVKGFHDNATLTGSMTIISDQVNVDILDGISVQGDGDDVFAMSGGALRIFGQDNFPSNFSDYSLTGGLVLYTYNGATDQVIKGGLTYNNLQIRNWDNYAGATRTLDGNIEVLGDLTLMDVYDLEVNDHTITLTGNFNVDDSFTGAVNWGEGTFIHNGTYLALDADITTFNNVFFTGSGWKDIFNNLTITGDFTLDNDINMNTTAFAITSDGTGSFTMNENSRYTTAVTGQKAFAMNFNSYSVDETSIFHFNGAADMELYTHNGTIEFGHLWVYGSAGDRFPDGTLNVNGNFLMNNNVTLSDQRHDFNLNGEILDLREYDATNTITLARDGNQVLRDNDNEVGDAFLLNNLVFDGSGTKTLTANHGTDTINIIGNVTIDEGVILSSQRKTDFGGTSWVNNGNFIMTNVATRPFVFYGDAEQTVDPGATNTYRYVTFSNSTATNFVNNGINIDQDLTVDEGDSVYFGKDITHHFASQNFFIDGGWNLDSANINFDRGNAQTLPGIKAQNVTISNGGTKTVETGDWHVNDLIIEAGILDMNADSVFDITITGNYIQTGGALWTVGDTVYFEADSAGQTKIIQILDYEQFQTVYFNLNSTNDRTYQINSNIEFQSDVFIGDGATVNLTGFTMDFGNNDEDDPIGEVMTIHSGGSLEVGPGATISFHCNDDGGLAGGELNDVGASIIVEDGGSFSLVGSEGSVASLNRGSGNYFYRITAESGATVAARYYTISNIWYNGFQLLDGATLDATNNFSDGIFSDMPTWWEFSSYYLWLENDAATTIDNVTFNFGGTPDQTFDLNVRRSTDVSNGTITFTNTKGVLGRPGANFEGEYDATGTVLNTVKDATLGVLRWDEVNAAIWVGTVSSDFFEAANWDIGIVPSGSKSVAATFDATIPLGQPFNPIIGEDDTARVVNIDITNGVLKLENGGRLEVSGDLTLGDGVSGTLVQSDELSEIEIEGSWLASTNASFSHGNSTVTMATPLAKVNTLQPQELPFYNLKVTNPLGSGDLSVSGLNIHVENDLTITDNGSFHPTTAGYRIYVGGDLNGNGGTFNNTSVFGRVVMNGTENQTLNDIDVNALDIANTAIVTVTDTVTIPNSLEIQDGATLLFAGHMDINGEVTIYEGGTLMGTDGYNIRFGHPNWWSAGTYGNNEGEVIFDRTNNQYILQLGDVPVEFNDLTITGGGNKFAGRSVAAGWIEGNINLYGNLDIDLVNRTFVIYDYQIQNIDTDPLSPDTMHMASTNSVITVSGADNFPSGFAVYDLEAGSQQRYSGVINQTIRGGITYGGLVLHTQTTKTLGGDIGVQNWLDLNASTLDVSENNYTINIQGTWLADNAADNGSFLGREGTVIFDGSALQQIRIAEGGVQDFYNIIVNNTGNTVINAVEDIEIDNNLTVLSGTYHTNNRYTYIGGSMIATGTGAFASGGNEVTARYYLNAPLGATPSIQTNGSSFFGITFDAPGATYTMLDDLEIRGNLLLDTNTILNVSGNTLTLGDGDDVAEVYGILNVSTTSSPGGTLRMGSGAQLAVKEEGVLSLVGTESQLATVSNHPTNGGTYTIRIDGSATQPATVHAQYYLIEFPSIGGFYITENGLIDTENNFSNGSFNNGFAGGTMLRIENTQDFIEDNLIENISFPSNPGGGATNITKSIATSGSIEIDNYSGAFSGELYDADDNGLITWLIPPIYTWTGLIDNDWFNEQNWDTGLVPDSTSEVYIPQFGAGVLNQPIVSDDDTARMKSLTLENGSFMQVDSDDDNGPDIIVEEAVTINNSVKLEFNGTNDVMQVGGDWNNDVSSGAIVTAGTSTIIFNPLTISNISNGVNSFYDVIVDASGTVIVTEDLIIDNDLVVQNGTLDLGNNDFTLGENLEILGAVTSGTGLFTLDPKSTADKTLAFGQGAFYDMEIGNATSATSAKYTVTAGDINVLHNLTIDNATLDLGTADIVHGDDDNATDRLDIYTDLVLGGQNQILFGDRSTLNVKSGATFCLVGAPGLPAKLANHPDFTGEYDFNVESGATMKAQYYSVDNIGEMGINFASGAVLDKTLNFSDGTFSNGTSNAVETGRYLTFNFANLAEKIDTIRNVIFNTGTDYNVVYETGAGTNDTIVFKNYIGARGGAAYEKDELAINAEDGYLRWFIEDQWEWVGTNSSNWYDGGNWIPARVPDSVSNVFIGNDKDRYPIIGFNSAADPSAIVLSIFIDEEASLTLNNDVGLYIDRNKEKEGGNVTNVGTMTVNGESIISIRGSWLNTGTFTAGNSTVIMGSDSGTVSLTTAGQAFNNFVLNDGLADKDMSIQQSDNLTVNGDFKLVDGVFVQQQNIEVGGDWDIKEDASFVVNTGTNITFSGNTEQTISDSSDVGGNFYDISFEGSGAKSLGTSFTFHEAFSVQSGVEVKAGTDTLTIKKGWTVNGTFTPENSVVDINGDAIQFLDAAGNLSFYELMVRNSATGNSDILVNKPISIEHKLSLYEGILENSGSNMITIEHGAVIAIDDTDGDSTNSYITGPLEKIGNDFIDNKMTFPVGKQGTYAPLVLENTGTVNTTKPIEVEYFLGEAPNNSNKGTDIGLVSLIEYWDVDFLETSPSYKVGLSWLDADRSGINDLNTLDVGHYTAGNWENFGGTSYGSLDGGIVTSESSITSSGPVSFVNISDAGVLNPLPVGFVRFNAELVNEVVNLLWITSFEENNHYFVIEKSSNAVDYDSIGYVMGQGTSTERNIYLHSDYDYDGTTAYYRIRQVDFDGTTSYSKVEAISLNSKQIVNEEPLQVYPVPIQDELNIAYPSSSATIYAVKLVDGFGRQISYNEVNDYTFTLSNLDQLSDGVYFIHAETSQGLKVVKLLKGL